MSQAAGRVRAIALSPPSGTGPVSFAANDVKRAPSRATGSGGRGDIHRPGRADPGPRGRAQIGEEVPGPGHDDVARVTVGVRKRASDVAFANPLIETQLSRGNVG